jgi:hypothetical protein
MVWLARKTNLSDFNLVYKICQPLVIHNKNYTKNFKNATAMQSEK